VPASEVCNALQRTLTGASETRGAGNSMISVLLFDLKFPIVFGCRWCGNFKLAAPGFVAQE
jgi:hypothetical protein